VTRLLGRILAISLLLSSAFCLPLLRFFVPGLGRPHSSTMGIKMPTLPKLSNPFQRREDGKMQFIGLTAMEWSTF